MYFLLEKSHLLTLCRNILLANLKYYRIINTFFVLVVCAEIGLNSTRISERRREKQPFVFLLLQKWLNIFK